MRIAGAFALGAVWFACGSRTELDAPKTMTVDASVDAPTITNDACPSAVTRTLQVPVESPWFDTGIDVVVETDVMIHATGTVRYGPNPPQTTDANGGNFDGQQFFSTAVLPSAVICSLIGKVGGSTSIGTGTPVPEGANGKGAGFVGVDYHEKMITNGRLFLGFNDQTTLFGDNSGAFTITITTKDPC